MALKIWPFSSLSLIVLALLLDFIITLQLKLSSFFTVRLHYSLTNTTSDFLKLHNFLNVECKSGNFTPSQAIAFFNYMIHTKPTPSVSSFNLLSGALSKKRHYSHVVVMFAKMGSVCLFRDLYTWNICWIVFAVYEESPMGL